MTINSLSEDSGCLLFPHLKSISERASQAVRSSQTLRSAHISSYDVELSLDASAVGMHVLGSPGTAPIAGCVIRVEGSKPSLKALLRLFTAPGSNAARTSPFFSDS